MNTEEDWSIISSSSDLDDDQATIESHEEGNGGETPQNVSSIATLRIPVLESSSARSSASAGSDSIVLVDHEITIDHEGSTGLSSTPTELEPKEREEESKPVGRIQMTIAFYEELAGGISSTFSRHFGGGGEDIATESESKDELITESSNNQKKIVKESRSVNSIVTSARAKAQDFGNQQMELISKQSPKTILISLLTFVTIILASSYVFRMVMVQIVAPQPLPQRQSSWTQLWNNSPPPQESRFFVWRTPPSPPPTTLSIMKSTLNKYIEQEADQFHHLVEIVSIETEKYSKESFKFLLKFQDLSEKLTNQLIQNSINYKLIIMEKSKILNKLLNSEAIKWNFFLNKEYKEISKQYEILSKEISIQLKLFSNKTKLKSKEFSKLILIQANEFNKFASIKSKEYGMTVSKCFNQFVYKSKDTYSILNTKLNYWTPIAISKLNFLYTESAKTSTVIVSKGLENSRSIFNQCKVFGSDLTRNALGNDTAGTLAKKGISKSYKTGTNIISKVLRSSAVGGYHATTWITSWI
ncbi:hypothetical protein CAAN1_08S04390 [[Candida] anglica]|uniref:SUN domain-containing protein n=1 Tax=[Candida] anglica TaxID=148631 RepID=A0ABP0E5M6_9ASCO